MIIRFRVHIDARQVCFAHTETRTDKNGKRAHAVHYRIARALDRPIKSNITRSERKQLYHKGWLSMTIERRTRAVIDMPQARLSIVRERVMCGKMFARWFL